MSADFQHLFDYGVLGAVVLWFMLRLEKLIAGNTTAINNNNKILAAVCGKLGIPVKADGGDSGD